MKINFKFKLPDQTQDKSIEYLRCVLEKHNCEFVFDLDFIPQKGNKIPFELNSGSKFLFEVSSVN